MVTRVALENARISKQTLQDVSSGRQAQSTTKFCTWLNTTFCQQLLYSTELHAAQAVTAATQRHAQSQTFPARTPGYGSAVCSRETSCAGDVANSSGA